MRLGGHLLACSLLACVAASAFPQSQPSQPQRMPLEQLITPLAPMGAVFSKLNPGLKDFPDCTVGQAVKTLISPDGNTLLILTSGYNRLNDDHGRQIPADSNEYVFVFDVAHGNLHQADWTFDAVMPAPIAKELSPHRLQDRSALEFHDAQAAFYWARQTRGFDWSQEDRIPAVLFNRILWNGLTGGLPYSAVHGGQDLSSDRVDVLKARSTHFLYQVRD